MSERLGRRNTVGTWRSDSDGSRRAQVRSRQTFATAFYNVPQRSSLEAMSDKEVAWRTNYTIFCLAYGVGFGLPVQCFDYSYDVLNKKVMSVGTGMLMSLIVIFSLGSGGLVAKLGPKRSEIAGLSMMIGFIASLAACAFVGKESILQWPIYLTGAVVCGLAMSLIPTALGPFTERSAVILSEATEDTVDETRSNLMGTFATINNGAQMVIVCLTMFLLKYILPQARDDVPNGEEIPFQRLFPILGVLVFSSLGLMAILRDPPSGQEETKSSTRQQCSNLLRILGDPRVWLLGFLGFNQGICVAFKGLAFTNSVTAELGASAVAAMNFIMSTVTLLSAKPVGFLQPYAGDAFFLGTGALAQFAIPLLMWYAPWSRDGFTVAIYYILVGWGWTTYDVTSRAVFLSHFPGVQSGPAFAAMNMQLFTAQAICYWMGSFVAAEDRERILERAIFALSLVIIPGYLVAECIRKKRQGTEDEEDGTDSEAGSTTE